MKILLVNLCDEWKSHSSKSLIGVIEEDDLAQNLFNLIKNGEAGVGINPDSADVYKEKDSSCEFGFDCELDVKCNECEHYYESEEQELDDEKLMNFLKNSSISQLNDCIDYLYIESVTLGDFNTDGCRL